MYQSVKKALEVLVEVDTSSLARRILSDQVLKVMENNYIPFLEIDGFDDSDRERLKDMVLPGKVLVKVCPGSCSIYLTSFRLSNHLVLLNVYGRRAERLTARGGNQQGQQIARMVDDGHDYAFVEMC
jgi:hypothetical protein